MRNTSAAGAAFQKSEVRQRFRRQALVSLIWVLVLSFSPTPSGVPASPRLRVPASPRLRVPASPHAHVPASQAEYLWYEAENMRGLATDRRGEPTLNPSWLNLPKAKAPGWSVNGPGVSAEWSQGGESEWNSVAAAADETRAILYQDIEVPRAGDYRVWARYADWANKTENFVIRIAQTGDGTSTSREVFRHEFGSKDVLDPHDEVSMYWGWAFAWDAAQARLEKGRARISLEVERPAEARRHVDSLLVTNDVAYIPEGRRKPDFAAMRYLRDWNKTRAPLTPFTEPAAGADVAAAWQRPKIGGRDFVMPWNIAKEFWALYDKPSAERLLYPFAAEPLPQFVEKYKGAQQVPLFDSKLVVPVIYLNDLPEYLKEGSAFLRYLRETKVPFAVLINFGAAKLSDEEGKAAWALLNGELRDQFIGWVSGESIGFVWDQAAADLKITPAMSRPELLEGYRVFYTNALDKKWNGTFHTDTGPMWDKLIPAQSAGGTAYAHALAEWGVRLLGMETAAVQPMTAMRIAFTRGAARQYGGAFAYYHAPNFGDTATTFTKTQNFAGPDNFFHTRYGATMGPSLSWYRKSYYLYYMSGASAIYLEQGFDQFFKPGPGENPIQLNPLGRITDEFMKFAEKHPDRGTPYTPVAFLLDPAHGWDLTDYPQLPFGMSQISRSDRALRELFAIAYYPGSVVEGEPATGDRQAFVSGVFGNIFDVIVASSKTSPAAGAKAQQSPKPDVQRPPVVNNALGREGDGLTTEGERADDVPSQSTPATSAGGRASVESKTHGSSRLSFAEPRRLLASESPLTNYRAVVVSGGIEWSPDWPKRLTDYVRNGGTVVLNASQVKGLSQELIGVRLTGIAAEAHNARCLSPGETPQDLSGQIFRYERVEAKGAQVLIETMTGDPLVTVQQLGKGRVVFAAVPDLLGEDERITPFAAHMLAHVFADVTPVRVSGDVEYLINRNPRGWVVTLINNNGVFKPQQGMAQVDRTANVTATVSLPGQKIQSASDWITDKTLELGNTTGQQSLSIKLAPGAIAVVELIVAK